MASRASVGSIDAGLSATAYALAQTPEDKHSIALKVKNGVLGCGARGRQRAVTNLRIGLENGSVKLSYVVLSMQDLVFDHSDPERKSGEGIITTLGNWLEADSGIAMAYLVAILKELGKAVLSRADSKC